MGAAGAPAGSPLAAPLAEAAEEEGEDAMRGLQSGYMFMVHQKRLHTAKRRHFFELHSSELQCFEECDDILLERFQLDARSSVMADPKSDLTFVLSTESACLHLSCATQAELSAWMASLIDAIDELPAAPTPLEDFVAELPRLDDATAAARAAELGLTHARLTASPDAVLPLTTIMHQAPFIGANGHLYERPEAEVSKVFSSLQPAGGPYGSVARDNVVPLISAIKTMCDELPRIRNEIYAQLVCLTTQPPQPQSPDNLAHWYLLAVLCAACPPASSRFVAFVKWHLTHCLQLGPTLG